MRKKEKGCVRKRKSERETLCVRQAETERERIKKGKKI